MYIIKATIPAKLLKSARTAKVGYCTGKPDCFDSLVAKAHKFTFADAMREQKRLKALGIVTKRIKLETKKTLAKKTKKNPVPPSKVAKLKNAINLYESFTGHKAEFYDEININWPDVGLKVGMCDGVLYETVRDGKVEHYIHKFKKSARPVLVAAHDGKGIALVGGKYRFTDRGIVDQN